MYRVPVISKFGKPLMPTKPSRARRWLKEGKARIYRNDLQQFAIQLTIDADTKTQPIAVGIDPGKLFTGIGVQSVKATLFTAHLELPFKSVTKRMSDRRMMRRGRRGRRINRKLPYNQRSHRQVRFNNRKARKLPPSIRSNRQLEYRVVKELTELFPVSGIVYEYIKAKGNKGFSPAMVGQKVMIEEWLPQLAPVTTRYGWETSNLRQYLGLTKDKSNKANQTPATHAVDGIALAAHYFLRWKELRGKYGYWQGICQVTPAPFLVVKRPPVSRRQLHLMVFAKGGKRRKYGATVTCHGLRKGDFVETERKGVKYRGWVSGDTKTQVSVSDFNSKRLGQFSVKKTKLLRRSTGLICKPLVGGAAFLPSLKARGDRREER
ncbi:MAG: hypothetical protein F6K36_14400 [Symploca sp. SIO3C6]|uniref:RRXRR domain-containing protein n=1 Tax=Symploca sp. SIO1C4 TaxID=2607765 RepID=A0A6B3N479_9CYAN|nr:hypothetical protein [Symploca sp. SIO3C6]NER28506.1 hypothetical protein [Symploca sp. SIO1C4]NET06552.1 hypothetical protein [Symploca sp. SIO2B6]